MNYESRNFTHYNSTEDDNFREAIMDMAKLAYANALYLDKDEGIVSDATIRDSEHEIDGKPVEYGFYAETSDGIIEVQSIRYDRLDNPTDAAVRLIHDEIKDSDIDSNIRTRFSYDFDEIKDSEVELFMRRTFRIDVMTGNIQVKRDMGYCIDSQEVRVRASDGEEVPELDAARANIFEEDDLNDYVTALRQLGIIEQADAGRLLNKTF